LSNEGPTSIKIEQSSRLNPEVFSPEVIPTTSFHRVLSKNTHFRGRRGVEIASYFYLFKMKRPIKGRDIKEKKYTTRDKERNKGI
jgi:hypothetical protein